MTTTWTLRATTGYAEYTPYTWYFCCNTASLQASEFPGRSYVFVDGVSAFGGGISGTIASGSISQGYLPVTAPYTRVFGSPCAGESETSEITKYDCVNGNCAASAQYKTPGIYTSLAECQLHCGVGNCEGVCVPNDEWQQINDLSSQLANRC